MDDAPFLPPPKSDCFCVESDQTARLNVPRVLIWLICEVDAVVTWKLHCFVDVPPVVAIALSDVSVPVDTSAVIHDAVDNDVVDSYLDAIHSPHSSLVGYDSDIVAAATAFAV